MEDHLIILAYAACVILIAAHAWDRFNTPSSNRSSTRRALYWSSFCGYVACALALFAVLTALLHIGAWRTAVLGHSDEPALPPPLMATLALTTLLPSVPLLKRLDARILATFHEWGEIPAEVKRRVATMTRIPLSVTTQDVVALRENYEDGSYGSLTEQLRARGETGLERSRLRFTRVVKLFDRITKLAGEDRYARYYDEMAVDFASLNQRVGEFLRRSSTSLALAARLQTFETEEAYEELMAERRQAFAQACDDIFKELALFLARAVLRSELTEKDIVRRLREIGFEAEPINLPQFPIDSLTALALGVFGYLGGLAVLFANVPSVAAQNPGMFMTTIKIGLIRVVTVGITVFLMQRYAFFRRLPDGPPRYFSYVVCGINAGFVSLLIGLLFHLGNSDILAGARAELPPIVLSAMLCATLAFCCDDGMRCIRPPMRRRAIEAAACGSIMLMGATFVYFGNLLSVQITGPLLGLWLVLPSLMATAIGFFVPHIYRAANQAATARRSELLDGVRSGGAAFASFG